MRQCRKIALATRTVVQYVGPTMLVVQTEALGLRQGKYKKRRRPVAGVVVHTTGAGPWNRWHGNPSKFTTPGAAAVHVYQHISPYSGHYVVDGETGGITQTAPENVVALHVGSAGGFKYRWPNWDKLEGMGWWAYRWPELRGPRALLGGKAWAPRPNEVTVGIEVSPPVDGPRAEWPAACWASLSWLCNGLADRYSIPRNRYFFVGHSDIHPLSRTAKGQPWDPNPRQWKPGAAMCRLFYPGAV